MQMLPERTFVRGKKWIRALVDDVSIKKKPIWFISEWQTMNWRRADAVRSIQTVAQRQKLEAREGVPYPVCCLWVSPPVRRTVLPLGLRADGRAPQLCASSRILGTCMCLQDKASSQPHWMHGASWRGFQNKRAKLAIVNTKFETVSSASCEIRI